MILCANSRPALNDVTYKELTIVVKRVCQICPVISKAYTEGSLAVMESGQGSPCLDLRLVYLIYLFKRPKRLLSKKNAKASWV